LNSREALFIHALIDRFPLLKSSLDEHIIDNDELLPHVYLGSVAQRLVSMTKDSADSQFVMDVLSFVEAAFEAGSPELDELISVSFIELLSPYDLDDRRVFDILPEKLSNEARKIWC
jgi:hypothetical protein